MTVGRKAAPTPPPLRGGEPVTIEAPAPFGQRAPICGELLLPPSRAPKVAVALSHAMMVDRRTLDQPPGVGLLSQLVAAGAAVLWIDQRGHGQSHPHAEKGGRWSHDTLVADAGVIAAYLAQRFPELPRVAVGHSLFGQVSLAHQTRASAGLASPGYDRLALIAVNVWMRELEPLFWRYLIKRLSFAALVALSAPLGYLPVRRLGLGTADEPHEYLAQMGAWMPRNDFVSGDGFSYLRALPAVRVPVLSVAGDGDRLLGVPACQLRLLSRLGGPLTHITVGRRFGDAIDPDHMQLVLDRRLEPLWRRIAAWVVDGLC